MENIIAFSDLYIKVKHFLQKLDWTCTELPGNNIFCLFGMAQCNAAPCLLNQHESKTMLQIA
jgi:hypothetical protein